MNVVFADTAGWVAMVDSDDPHGAEIRGWRDRHLRAGGHLLTTDYVIDETLTLLRMCLGLDAAFRWWELVRDSPAVLFEDVHPGRADRAREWFFGWRDRRFSFTDCTSFAVMRELGLTRALTLDRHFAQAGFELVPVSPPG